MGKEAVKAFYESVQAALGEGERDPPRLAFHETMTDGDLYCCRFTMSGTDRGPSWAFPPAAGRMRWMASPSCASRASA
jgi:hypothetical protein